MDRPKPAGQFRDVVYRPGIGAVTNGDLKASDPRPVSGSANSALPTSAAIVSAAVAHHFGEVSRIRRAPPCQIKPG